MPDHTSEAQRSAPAGTQPITPDLFERFLSRVVHDLRNIVSSVDISFRLLERPEKAGDRQWIRVSLQSQIRNLLRQVADVGDLSRIARGDIELDRQPFELALLVNAAVTAARPQIEERRHVFEIVLPEQPVIVTVDRRRFERVLVNLLVNAAQYMDEGGTMSLHAETGPGTITVRIRDSGPGISAEHLEACWGLAVEDLASQLASPEVHLGLAVCRRLVELHGGQLTFSPLNPGTEFAITLPR